jgi:O-antigen/teichoic acid export membrane protein
MLNKIIQTIFSKGIISIINFLIVILTAKFTGSEGRGQMSLMYLNVTLILMINDLIGGSALVYLIPKLKARRLVLPSYSIAIISGFLLPFIFNLYLGYDFKDYLWFTFLSLTLNLSSVSNMFLNGLEKIKHNNIANIIQTLTLFFNFIYSFIQLRKDIFPIEKANFFSICKEILSYGFIVQAGNAIQLLNYRLSYYLLDHFFPVQGKQYVGVFSTGSSVAEAVWVIMNGISMVQYATLANNDNKQFAISYSIKLSKICFILTTFAVLVLLLMPNTVFIYLFGQDFSEMRNVIMLISPGIVLMGFTGIYSHYFAGIGMMKVSTQASLLAFAVTAICGIIFIPKFGIEGAAYTSCLSYIISSLYLIVSFKIKTKASITEQFFTFNNILKLNK